MFLKWWLEPFFLLYWSETFFPVDCLLIGFRVLCCCADWNELGSKGIKGNGRTSWCRGRYKALLRALQSTFRPNLLLLLRLLRTQSARNKENTKTKQRRNKMRSRPIPTKFLFFCDRGRDRWSFTFVFLFCLYVQGSYSLSNHHSVSYCYVIGWISCFGACPSPPCAADVDCRVCCWRETCWTCSSI